MNPHIIFLANQFYAMAVVLGVPSLAVTLVYVGYRIQLWLAPSSTASSFGNVSNPDGVLLVLEGITRTAGGLAAVWRFVEKFVLGGIAIVACGVLVIAVALFLVGRGLQGHQDWARLTAGLIMTGLVLTALLSVTSIRGPRVLLSFGVTAVGLYNLWALWRGFQI